MAGFRSVKGALGDISKLFEIQHLVLEEPEGKFKIVTVEKELPRGYVYKNSFFGKQVYITKDDPRIREKYSD